MAARRYSNRLGALAVGAARALSSLALALAAGPVGAANSQLELQRVLDAAMPGDEIAVIVGYQPNWHPTRYRKAFETGEIESATVQKDARHARRQIIKA